MSDMDPCEKWRPLWCVIPGDINPFVWIGSNTNNSRRPVCAMIHDETECWESWLKKWASRQITRCSLIGLKTHCALTYRRFQCFADRNAFFLFVSNFSHSWCLSDLPDVTAPQLPSQFGSGAPCLTGNKWLSSWLRLSEIAHHEWLLLLSRRPQVKEGVLEMDSLCHSPLERARLFEEMSRVWVRVSN